MADPGKLAAVLAKMRPTPRPDQPEDALTPGQWNGLQYSRDRYADGSYQVNPGPDPSITSFMGAISQAPDGQYVNYPTFWDGKVIDPKTAFQKAMQYEAATGKAFARYPSIDAAEAGESAVHKLMEADSQKLMQSPQYRKRVGGR